MKTRVRFPLLARVLAWLCLHLVILALCFFLFVRWQLGLGLDSLLSGSAGDRLAAFGDNIVSKIVELPPREWNGAIESLAGERDVRAAIFDPSDVAGFPMPVPFNVIERARSSTPPRRLRNGPPRGRPGRPPGPEFDRPARRNFQPERPDGEGAAVFLSKSRPSFLVRADNGDGYWAGVLLHLPPSEGLPRGPVVLLVRADRLDGSGMFFEFKPWLWGGIAVLILSLAFWTPFVWGIARYVRRLTRATERIASGEFKVSLPPRGSDELGDLGRTVEVMAARLDHLISGQKRFLGDAAHELCAPLARIRTGLGVLEARLASEDSQAVQSIEADTGELAALVNEILAFSRTGNRSPSCERIELEEFVREVISREAAPISVDVSIPPGLRVFADPVLLGRAIGNLIRNAAIHAGPDAGMQIRGEESPDAVVLSLTDNGVGVPPDEITRIFEPFYRLDRSRSRDTGGSGLGLAIVRTAIENCGGETSASLPSGGGLRVALRLPKSDAPIHRG